MGDKDTDNRSRFLIGPVRKFYMEHHQREKCETERGAGGGGGGVAGTMLSTSLIMWPQKPN